MNEHCSECGMLISPGAYHPYAACLMFRGCRDGAVVTANLDGVRAYGAQHDSGFDNAADRIAALELRIAGLDEELVSRTHEREELREALAEGAEYLHAFTDPGTPAVDAFIARWRFGVETDCVHDFRRYAINNADSPLDTPDLCYTPFKCIKCGIPAPTENREGEHG